MADNKQLITIDFGLTDSLDTANVKTEFIYDGDHNVVLPKDIHYDFLNS